MRKLMISAALLSAAAVAAPAAAQYQAPRYGVGQSDFRGGGLEAQLRQLDERIRSSFQRGLLSRNEANRLSAEVREIRSRLYHRGRNGISPRERQRLQERVQNLRQRLQSELREGRDQRRDRRW